MLMPSVLGEEGKLNAVTHGQRGEGVKNVKISRTSFMDTSYECKERQIVCVDLREKL